MRRNISYLLILIATCIYSCNENNKKTNYYNANEVQYVLREYLNNIDNFDTINLKHNITFPIEIQIAEAYFLNDNKLIWARPNGYHQALKEYVIQIANLEDEGIKFSDIKLSRIEYITNQIIAQYEHNQNFNLDSIITYDIELTKTYLTLAKQILMGQSKHIRSDINDSFFAGGEYLALATNKSQGFPSFDGFRPDNPLYTKLLLANKNWMILQNDPEYIEAKVQLRNGNSSQEIINTIINKELLLSNKDLDFSNQVKIYQHYRNLEKTGVVDKKTIEILQRKPEEYKIRIRENLEKLRFLHSQKDEQFIIINSFNNIYKFYSNGILIFKGNVTINKVDSNHIYETILENIIERLPFSNYINISTIKLQANNAFRNLSNELIVVNPNNNSIVAPALISIDSITKYVVFKKKGTKDSISNIQNYINNNSSNSPEIAVNTWPFISDNRMEIKFLEVHKLLKAIQKYSQLINNNQEKPINNNHIFSKGIPIYVIHLNFVSDIDTGELIYLN